MLAGLEILLVGIVVVMSVLCMLWASCSIVGFGFRTVEAWQKATEARKRDAVSASVAVPVASDIPVGVPPHHLTAIVAATAAVMDRPYRIAQVWAPVVPASDWSNQARLQTFNSHRRQGDWGHALPDLDAAQSQTR